MHSDYRKHPKSCARRPLGVNSNDKSKSRFSAALFETFSWKRFRPGSRRSIACNSSSIDVDPILPWSDEMQRRFSLSNPAEEGGVPDHAYVSAVNCSSSPDPVELR